MDFGKFTVPTDRIRSIDLDYRTPGGRPRVLLVVESDDGALPLRIFLDETMRPEVLKLVSSKTLSFPVFKG